MDIDIQAQTERLIADLFTRVRALEDAMTKLPEVNMQADPSRPPGVVVEPFSVVEPAALIIEEGT